MYTYIMPVNEAIEAPMGEVLVVVKISDGKLVEIKKEVEKRTELRQVYRRAKDREVMLGYVDLMKSMGGVIGKKDIAMSFLSPDVRDVFIFPCGKWVLY